MFFSICLLMEFLLSSVSFLCMKEFLSYDFLFSYMSSCEINKKCLFFPAENLNQFILFVSAHEREFLLKIVKKSKEISKFMALNGRNKFFSC